MKQTIIQFQNEAEARYVARELSKLAEQRRATAEGNDVESTEMLSQDATLLEETSISIQQSYGELFLMKEGPMDIPKPELSDRTDCNTKEEIIDDIVCNIDFEFNMTWAYMLSVESEAHELAYRTRDRDHVSLWQQIVRMRAELNKAHVDLMDQHDRKPGIYTQEIIADHTGDQKEKE